VRCHDCIFYYYAEAGRHSECRRYPPIVCNVDHRDAYARAYWPSVLEQDWCGEFCATVEYIVNSTKGSDAVK
jgi:hypothetical protein